MVEEGDSSIQDEASEVPAKGGVCGPKITARYTLAVLGSIGMGIIYGLKVNLHVAIVSMVNTTAVYASEHHQLKSMASQQNLTNTVELCGDGAGPENGTDLIKEDGPFAWSTNVQGLLLSAYFWGYLVSQLPGGRIAETFSAKMVMFFAVAINVLGALLTPLLATLHYGVLLGVRVAQGIGGGVTFPAMHVLLAHWAPPNERSVMSSITYAGTALGSVIFMLTAGLIAGALTWEAVFYIQGGISALWMILWCWLVADSPQQQRHITPEERKLITEALHGAGSGSQRQKKRKLKIPWRAVFTSPAFLAILTAHTCSNWGWYMVLIELPSYMKTVLNFKISSNAVLSALPFFTMWIFSMILSNILDRLLSHQKITATTARKTATLIASLPPAICFVILCFIGCQRTLAVVLMTVAVTSIGGMFCGFLSNHIDIAPNFAGTLVAITNTVATVPGIVVPIFVGYLTHSDPSINSWRIVFWVTIGLYGIEILVYMLCGSGEAQKWNEPPEEATSVEEHPLKPSGR